MPRRLIHLPPALLAALAFVLAALLMTGIAFAAVLVIESRSASVVGARLQEAKMEWITLDTDGLQLHLSGTAPNETARFRALNLVGSLVDSSRVHDAMDVAPTTALSAPRFSVEMLRNDDGIQLIGLMPTQVELNGITAEGLAAAAAALTPPGTDPANMLQAANWPAPQGWDDALRFGTEALGLLNRSKISVAAGRVEITAITGSEDEKRRLLAQLERRRPADVRMLTDISAPRPVITPFTLRFIKDEEGARFDACSADTERARSQIIAAAVAGGLELPGSCLIGLGTPSPRWGEGAVAAIRAVTQMGAGSVTFSDGDVTLTAGTGVTPEAFDGAVGDLRVALPDVFSLEAIPPVAESVNLGPAEFTARALPEGRVELRGLVTDEAQQAVVVTFARGAFGGARVHNATRLDPELPDGWPIRILAGLESLSVLNEGSLLVRPDLVEVRGVTGSQEARARITQILSSRLGQGQTFRVDVRYEEKLDPQAALPTPQECAVQLAQIIARKKITFPPSSVEITGEISPVIAELAEVVRVCPGVPIEIAGHTDSQGSDSGNLALSQARAEAVLMALQGRRVDVSAMTAVGYGENHPIADNSTEEGREANRRIEFMLRMPRNAPVAAAAPAASAPAAAAQESDIELIDPEEAGLYDPEMDAETEGSGEEGAEPQPEPAAAEATAPAAAAGAAEPAPDAEITPPDFSHDTSPSVAPTEMTIRPLPRPARD